MKKLKVMKTINKILMIVFVSVVALITSKLQAQNTTNKPNAFDNYAAELTANQATMEQLFTMQKGTAVNMPIATNLMLVGSVASNVQVYNNLQTVIVRLTNFPNVVLSISKLSDKYTPEKYVGRLLSSNYADAFEVEQLGNSYILKKQITAQIIQPCKQ